MEALTGEKTPGQIAKQYGIHPNSVGLWKKEFLERGAEMFAEDGTVQEYERRIRQLEQLVGKKEVEIALLKNFGSPPKSVGGSLCRIMETARAAPPV